MRQYKRERGRERGKNGEINCHSALTTEFQEEDTMNESSQNSINSGLKGIWLYRTAI